jgi:hypothetical protein
LSCLVLSCLVLSLSCLVLSCLVLSCLVLSCLVSSCLVLSCLVVSCLVLSGLVWSGLVLSYVSRGSRCLPVVAALLFLTCFLTVFCICISCLRKRPRKCTCCRPQSRWKGCLCVGTHVRCNVVPQKTKTSKIRRSEASVFCTGCKSSMEITRLMLCVGTPTL